MTRGNGISGILKYIRSGEFLDNYTIGSGSEVIPERKVSFYNKFELRLIGKHA